MSHRAHTPAPSRHAAQPTATRQRRHSFVQPAVNLKAPPSAAPPAYAEAYAAHGYVPQVLPTWAPYPAYHAPQPAAPPRPTGYGYFQWPADEDDDLKEEKRSRTPAPSIRTKRGSIFSGLKRKIAGSESHLHMLLLHARPSPLNWDIRNAPTTASAPHPHGGARLISHPERAQMATSPPRGFLRISCDLVPWTIEIVRPGGVTVGDVLDEMYAGLHRRVRRSEWLIAAEGMQEKIIRAFAWRCYNATAPPGWEEQQGPKRVDWLLKRTVFRGLSQGPDEDTFVLHLAPH